MSNDDNIWRLPPRIVEAHVAESELGEKLPWHVTTPGIDKLHGIATGAGIKVGIVDTGVSQIHQKSGNDLAGVAAVNDFTGSRFGTEDIHGHGSHVAGIVGARRGNARGVVGIAPDVTLYCAKALGDDGTGRGHWIADAIAWCVSQGCHIINLSLGSPAPDSAILREIHKAVDHGVFVCAAAGNGGEFSTSWPASDEATIAVASVGRTGIISDFSEPSSVDVCFYGEQILSCYKAGGFASLSGTSMADPGFVGCLALLLEFEKKHGLVSTTPTNILDRLALWCDEVKATAKNPRTGFGLPNVARMLKLPTTEPHPIPPVDRPPGVPPIGHTWQRRWVAEPLPVPNST